MRGFVGLIMAVALGGQPGQAADPSPSGTVCVRTTHWFPVVRRSTRCYTAREFRIWQQQQRELQAAARLEQLRRDRRRMEDRQEERRRAEDRLRMAREDRLREERARVRRDPDRH